MTHHERMMLVIAGKKPDRIPWAPRLEIWYEAHYNQGTLPERFQGYSLREIYRQMDLGIRAEKNLFETKIKEVTIREEQDGNLFRRTYIAPIGEVTESFNRDPQAKLKGLSDEVQIEHLIKGINDYRVVQYMMEHTSYHPTYKEYLDYEQEIGEDGVLLGYTYYDPMFAILFYYIGFNTAYYELADHHEAVENLYYLLKNKLKEMQEEVVFNSPAKIVFHGSHYSMMTPPPIFNRYMVPYFKEFNSKLHLTGKIHAVHADADSKLLLQSFLDAGIDLVDCYCTAPMVSVSMEETLEAWEDKIIIWGGIPSILLCPNTTSYEDFISYMENLFKLLRRKSHRVILGVADNVMPEADITRIEKISEMVSKFTY